MNLILFIGIQATGKSTFYRNMFADTHIRLNLDMLKTRHREKLLFQACLEAKQPCVIDNTNPTRADRARYITAAKDHRFSVHGYYFSSTIDAAIERNQARAASEIVPVSALRGTRNQLQLPEHSEGFDTLHFVKLEAGGTFDVEEWTSDF